MTQYNELEEKINELHDHFWNYKYSETLAAIQCVLFMEILDELKKLKQGEQ